MKRLKKGFSLVEGVIALAVIAIVSVAVTALCIYGARTTPKLYAKFQASNIAADVVTCFDMACSNDSNSTTNYNNDSNSTTNYNNDLEKYLTFYVYGSSDNENKVTGENSNSNSNIYTYSFTIDNVRAVVTADFTNESVTINTYYGSSTDVLYSYEYTASTSSTNTGGD